MVGFLVRKTVKRVDNGLLTNYVVFGCAYYHTAVQNTIANGT
jgi:hypothetical protein